MKKIHAGALMLTAAVAGLALGGAPAIAYPIQPVPPMTIVPTFSCSVSPGGGNSIAIGITKANAAPLGKHPVTAIVNTPNGRQTVAVCGDQFTSNNTGTTVTTSINKTSQDKSYIYTCTASYNATEKCFVPGQIN